MADTYTREALHAHYAAMRDSLDRALEGLTEAQLTERSIDRWSVKDHLVHVIVWDEVRRLEIERIGAGGAPAWPPDMTGEQVDVFNNLTADLRRGLSVAQVRRELDASLDAVLATIDAAPDEALDQARYGESGLKSDHRAEHADTILKWRREKGY